MAMLMRDLAACLMLALLAIPAVWLWISGQMDGVA